MGQTLKRDDSEAADTDADIDALPAEEMDEATFYTNIDPAKPGKLKGISTIFASISVTDIVVDADLMLSGLTDEDDTFKAELVRTDGTRIPGTFTCDANTCVPPTVATVSNLVIRSLVVIPLLIGNLNPTIMSKKGKLQTPIICISGIG